MDRFRRVYIEISNVCNLKCTFCPEVERQSQVMSSEFFRDVVAQVAPLTDEVCLHLMGEPLGHPHLREVLEACAEFKVPVNLTTNGVLLQGPRLELALQPIVRQVNISIHSFEANFKSADVLPYMRRVFAFTRRARTQRPDIFVNLRLWDLKSSSSLSEENIAIRGLIGEEFNVDLNDWTVDVRRKKGYRLIDNIYLNFDSRFEWPHPSQPIRSSRGTCYGMINHIGIHADGTVVPCCLDKEAVINLGNLGVTRLDEILRSPRARGIQEGFRRGELREDLCQRCTFIERFDSKVRKQFGSRLIDPTIGIASVRTTLG